MDLDAIRRKRRALLRRSELNGILGVLNTFPEAPLEMGAVLSASFGGLNAGKPNPNPDLRRAALPEPSDHTEET